MSLNIRALQYAGQLSHDIPRSKATRADTDL